MRRWQRRGVKLPRQRTPAKVRMKPRGDIRVWERRHVKVTADANP